MALDLVYATGASVTVTNTEKSLSVTGGADLVAGVPFVRTDAAVFMLVLDGIASLVFGDLFRWRIYEKAVAGVTQRLAHTDLIRGPMTQQLWTPSFTLGIGWDWTLQRISATSRAFNWSIRRVY